MPPAAGEVAVSTEVNTSADSAEKHLIKAVPQVVEAIGQISNYFGSAPSGHPAEPSGQPEEVRESSRALQPGVKEVTAPGSGTVGEVSQLGSTAIGHLSHESIGRLAGEIAKKLDHGGDGGNSADLPSYAPEKCIASDSGYVTATAAGKGSPVEPAHAAVDEGGAESGVDKLKDILVSEKDIFGADGDEGMADVGDVGDAGDTGNADDMSDTGDTGDVGDIGDTGDVGDTSDCMDTDTNSNIDCKTSEGTTTSSLLDGPTAEEMKAQFEWLTSLTGQLQDTTSTSK